MDLFDKNLLHAYKLRRGRAHASTYEVLQEYCVSRRADEIRKRVQDFIAEHQLASSELEILSLLFAVRIELYEAPGELKEVYSPFQGAVRDTVRIAFVEGMYFLLYYTNSPNPPERVTSMLSKLHL